MKLNYDSCYRLNKTALLKGAQIFGLTFLGDGATIKRAPLINCLAMCGNSPPVVVAIDDCSEHMVDGGKKDTSYIAHLFGEKFAEYDPGKVFTDLFFFDGASNVQKGGKILTVQYSRTYCLHGGDHDVVSLFFSDIANFIPIQVCGYVYIPFVVL